MVSDNHASLALYRNLKKKWVQGGNCPSCSEEEVAEIDMLLFVKCI